MQKAIASKDRMLAAKGADFARTSWTKDLQRGYKAYEENLLHFYCATHDTTSYLPQATTFYDRYYMTLPNDSVQARAAREQAARLARMRVPPTSSAPDSATRKVAAVPNGPNSFVLELNNAAWEVYKTGTRTNRYLSRALAWSKRTVSLDPHAYNYDTLAHLLYRLQFFSEAEAMQQQAIALAEKERQDPTQYRKELQKIKARQL
jgi:tetratricopeptide (TPR) repeat protein